MSACSHAEQLQIEQCEIHVNGRQLAACPVVKAHVIPCQVRPSEIIVTVGTAVLGIVPVEEFVAAHMRVNEGIHRNQPEANR